MALIKKKDLKAMKKEEIESKLKELQLELIKGSLPANRQNAKTKEIKRTISRLITLRESQDPLRTK